MARLIAAVLLWLTALAAPAHAQAPRWVPEAGTTPYRYETVTDVPGAPGQRFRIDYDLVSDGKGGVVAVVRAAASAQGAAEWGEIEVEADCRKALKGQGDELARVTLSPITPAMLSRLGSDFMDDCAPTELFFPLTDVLNLTLIQVAPEYGLSTLAKPGDSRATPGHKAAYERLDTALDFDVPGGTLTLDSLEPNRATVIFESSANVRLIHRRAYSGADVTLTGTEHSALRLTIDPRTGWLLGAESTRSELDVIMSLPGDYTQPMKIGRTIKVSPRP